MILITMTIISLGVGFTVGWYVHKDKMKRAWVKQLHDILEMQNKPHKNNVIKFNSSRKQEIKGPVAQR